MMKTQIASVVTLACVQTAILSPILHANETEIIVVSGAQAKQTWLESGASLEIANAPTNTMLFDSAGLFSDISGIQADSRANFAQDTRISIRGFGSRSAFGIRGLYLQQDGIALGTPDGQSQLSSVLLDNISHVEVLKGPLALLYGNASGGVISLYSKEPQINSLSFKTAGSEHNRQHQLHVNYLNKKQSLTLSLKRFNSDGYRPHASATKNQAQLIHHYVFDNDLKLTTKLDYAYDPKLQDPLGLSFTSWQQNDKQSDALASRFDTQKTTKNRQISFKLTPEYAPDNWHIAAWTGDRQINQRLSFSGQSLSSSGGEVLLDRQLSGVNANYSLIHNDNINLRLGTSASHSSDERLGFVNNNGVRGDVRRDQTDTATNQDAYIRLNAKLSPTLQLEGGARYSGLKLSIKDRFINVQNPDDSGQKRFYNNALALAVNYRINQPISFFISAGKGFESPTLSEVAYKNTGNGVNFDLNASTNKQWESGFKWQHSRLTGSINYFNAETKNEILVDSNINGRTSYKNAGQTKRSGVEFHALFKHNDYFKQSLNISYLDAIFSDSEWAKNQLPGIAKEQVNWQLNLTPWQDSTEFMLSSHYRSGMYTNDDNQQRVPSFVTFSLSAQHQKSIQNILLDMWLSINNITDKKYVGSVIVNQTNDRAIEPAPSREVSVGLGLSYLW